MGTAADERDWETLVSCYTEEPHLDYTSLSGGEPERVAARRLVLERWRPLSRSSTPFSTSSALDEESTHLASESAVRIAATVSSGASNGTK